MNYRTLADMAALIRKNLHVIPRLPVVGIPRSGMIAASMIATMKNLPLYTPTEFHMSEPHLLVDDTISGGETFKRVQRSGAVTLAVWRKPESPEIDIVLETLPGPRIFEWNWAKHPRLRHAVVDIDGVICDETEKIKNWDDMTHVEAVRMNAKLLHYPSKTVLAIATGRREAERPITERWLANHGVRYSHIFFSTPERSARETKLLAARATGARWIVESNEHQAEWLAGHSGLPVLCTDLNRMI